MKGFDFAIECVIKYTFTFTAFQATQQQVVNDAASGYATPTVGFETVDECGLRYLMAMKQHEYLLLCLPLQQKRSLRSRCGSWYLYIYITPLLFLV